MQSCGIAGARKCAENSQPCLSTTISTTCLSSMKYPKKCQLAIRATPTMHDAREMNTILVSSIHALFGDFRGENYVVGLKVEKATDTDHSFTIECPGESAAAVRSALSMVTPPGYLSNVIYRFDVVRITS
eukprot:scaffold1638_cov120-Cylindrotheca_fusiformis.AAC.10